MNTRRQESRSRLQEARNRSIEDRKEESLSAAGQRPLALAETHWHGNRSLALSQERRLADARRKGTGVASRDLTDAKGINVKL
jgi:hypothetical protein